MGVYGDDFPHDESQLLDDIGLKEQSRRGSSEQGTTVIPHRLQNLTKVPHFDHAVNWHNLATTGQSESAFISSHVRDCGMLLTRAAKLCLRSGPETDTISSLDTRFAF